MNIKILIFIILSSLTFCFSQQTSMYLRVDFNEPMDTIDGLTTLSNYSIIGRTIPDTVEILGVGFHGTISGNNFNDDNLIDTIIIVTGAHLHKQFYRLEVNNVYDLAHNIINPDSNWYIYWVESPLPVELSIFTATSNKKGIANLYWRTETEINNYGFEIERAIEQKFEYFHSWQTIGFVQGYGNSNSPKEYRYSDTLRTTKPVKIFYRLKQIDTDGQYEYSRVVSVEVKNVLDTPTLFLYPNPFNSQIVLETYFDTKVNVVGQIFNILGEEVYNWKMDDVVGIYKVPLNFDVSLPTGVYIFQLSTNIHYPIRVKGIFVK